MSNGLICGYITGILDRRIVTSYVKRNLLQSIEILWLLFITLSTEYFEPSNPIRVHICGIGVASKKYQKWWAIQLAIHSTACA